MKTLAGLVLAAAGIYLVLLLLLYVTQLRLIHQAGTPGRELTATPADIGLPWEEVAITTADGVDLHGWFLPSPQTSQRTLVFFHGNAGNISHRLETLEIFHELGLATLIIDYRGYGRSAGNPSETGLYRDAEAAWEYLVSTRQVPPGQLIVFGRSLGAAVAAHLAVARPVGALILESAFTSVPDLAADLYPIFPVRLLARIRYPTRALVQQVDVPVLVVHSPDDEIIPFQHGEAVFEAAPEPKQLLRIGGDHNSGFLRSRSVYKANLAAWIADLPAND